MEATSSTIEKPTIDDVLKKLEKISRIQCVASDDGTRKQSSSPNCDTRQALEETQSEDKENRSELIDAPGSGLAPSKMLAPPFRTAGQQQKESDKIRSLSIQLRLMRQKGQRGHMKNLDLRGTKTFIAGSMEAPSEAVYGLAVQGRSEITSDEQEQLAKHEEVVKQALRMASAATKLQSAFRGSMLRIKLLQMKKNAAALANAASGISRAWRRFYCRRKYIQIVRDVILCQSVARRCSSKKKAEEVKSKRRIKSATIIQTKWRTHAMMQEFGNAKSRIVKSQATLRMWLTARRLKVLSREVSFALKKYYSELGCKYITAVDVTLSQSMVRLHQQMAACMDIQAKCGVFASKKYQLESNYREHSEGEEKKQMKSNAVTKLSSSWRRFHFQTMYTRTLRCVITCQSIFRRDSALRKVQQLRTEHRRNCSTTLIQTQWRKFRATKTFKRTRSATITLQAAVRMWTAARRWTMLRQEILSAFMRFQSQGAYILTAKDVAVCQSVVKRCSLTKAKTAKSKDDKTKPSYDGTPATYVTVDTSNNITALCNQILAEPGVHTDSHDFAMIYMSMISPEADVEAIYLSPRSKEEN